MSFRFRLNAALKAAVRPNLANFLSLEHFLMGQLRPLFVYFRPFLVAISVIQSEKSIDGVLGIRTLGPRMVAKEETTQLWWPSLEQFFSDCLFT